MNTMKGIVLQGMTPELRNDLPVPPVAQNEIRVKILYSSVIGHETELVSHKSMQILNKLLGARGDVQTGLEFSGIAETDGEFISKGEKVLGYVDMTKGWKAHAEYISIPEMYLAPLPDALSPADAAALPMSGLSALVALREIANVTANDSILILGASGGVGVIAVQIAKLLGAKTTAVASAKHHPLLIELGADTLIDYQKTDITKIEQKYDLVFDLTTMYRYKQIRHLLTDDGVFIPANPLNSLSAILFHRKSARWLFVDRGNSKLITELAEWAVSGKLRLIIDSVFDFADYKGAFERGFLRGKAGRVLMKM